MNLKIANTNNPTSLLDWSTVEALIRNREYQSENRGKSFIMMILDQYFSIDPHYADEYITDGGQDRGIDAIIIDEEEEKLSLLNFKTVQKFEKSKNCFPGNEVDKIINFINSLLKKESILLEQVNPQLQAKIESIWGILEDGKKLNIELHLFSNQSPLISHDFERLHQFLMSKNMSFHQAHLKNIADGIAQNFAPPANRKIKLLDRQKYEFSHNGIRMFCGNCSLADLAKFISADKNGEEVFDRRLLHQNVRGILEGNQPIHDEITKTLSSETLDWFPFLNNGITIICEKIIAQTAGNFPLHLEKPQIVNGAQTASCIHTAYRTRSQKFEDAVVNVKIIETADKELLEKIAITTNSQARVYSRDLRANDDVQKKISVAVDRKGYFYKRRRGDKSNLPQTKIIDSLRLGQIIQSTFLGAPHLAKTASNEIFGENFEDIFDEEKISADIAIALHEFDAKINEFKNNRRMKGIEHSTPYFEHWQTEGQFHLTWLAYYMANGETAEIKISNAAKTIPQAAQKIDDYYNKQERPSAYRIFRSSKSTSDLKQNARPKLQTSVQGDLFS